MICWYVVIERIYLLKFEEERKGVYLKFRSLFEEPIGGLSSPQGLPRMSIPIAIIMSSWFWLWAKNEHYWFQTNGQWSICQDFFPIRILWKNSKLLFQRIYLSRICTFLKVALVLYLYSEIIYCSTALW